MGALNIERNCEAGMGDCQMITLGSKCCEFRLGGGYCYGWTDPGKTL